MSSGRKTYLIVRGWLATYLATLLLGAAVWYAEAVYRYQPVTVAYDFSSEPAELLWVEPLAPFAIDPDRAGYVSRSAIEGTK